MTINANRDRKKQPCSHVSRREAFKRRRLPLFWCCCFFFGLVDLRHGTNRRVPCWFWSRLTPSRSGGLHPLPTAAPAQIHGPHGSGSNKKRFGGRSWERGSKNRVRLGVKLPSLTQVHHGAGAFQLESPPNPRLASHINPFVTTATTETRTVWDLNPSQTIETGKHSHKVNIECNISKHKRRLVK